MIEKIELAKQILMLEIESGDDVYILRELSQDHLPYSFRYYDSLFRMVHDRVNFDKKQLQAFKNRLIQEVINETNKKSERDHTQGQFIRIKNEEHDDKEIDIQATIDHFGI